MRAEIVEEVRKDFLSTEEKDCCKTAFLSAAIRGAGELGFTFKGFALSFRLSDPRLADKIAECINSLCKINLVKEESYIDMGYSKGNFYTLAVPVETAASLLERCAIVRNKCEIVEELPSSLVGKNCCKKAYLRGLFLSCGYLAVPDQISEWSGGKTRSGYAMEFNLNSAIVMEGVRKLIATAAKLPLSKILVRKKGSVVYLKTAEAVSAVLAAAGSSSGVLALQEIIAERQWKNDINRVNNFDLANVEKSMAASEKQLADIEKIDRTVGIDSLGAALAETCRMRRAYPDAGLAELGEKFSPPISKSCINHRLRKISALAEGLKEN